MQVDVLGQTAVIGVEVLVVPLVSAVECAVAILPRVVAAHGHHVLTFLYIRCQVEAESHHAVVAEAHLLAVQPDIGSLTGTLELNEDLALHVALADGESLAIPAHGVGQVNDVLTEGLIAVECVWQRDALPSSVVIVGACGFGHVAHLQPPVVIEVELPALDSRCRDGQYQCEKEQHLPHGEKPFHTLPFI